MSSQNNDDLDFLAEEKPKAANYIFDPLHDEPRLSQDYESPAAPPTDIKETLSPQDPRTDGEMQPAEIYDEGITGATDFNAHHGEPTAPHYGHLNPKE
ncbi:MAG: hypothetical protein PVI21_02270 [Candidatus Woesebacteria bacterium]|jgi:hypothetical protein